ncbi:MAG: ABC-2 family transporter protein [Clostridiales bacterium]|nr:ABC-2 family transporter protein [Clostridiales bacterium]
MRINKAIRKLKIYWPFAKSSMLQALAYKAGALFMNVYMFMSIAISYFLWSAIFDSSGSGMLQGFSKPEMLVYIVISAVAGALSRVYITEDIGREIVDGSIATALIKPVSYVLRWLFSAFGGFVVSLVMPCWLIIAGMIFHGLATGSFAPTPAGVAVFALSALLGFAISFLFEFCFSLLSFYTTYIWGLAIFKDAIVGLLSGAAIPLAFFPGAIRGAIEFMPFAGINYIPVMIFLGKIQGLDMLAFLARQAFWIAALSLAVKILWGRALRRLVVLGG